MNAMNIRVNKKLNRYLQEQSKIRSKQPKKSAIFKSKREYKANKPGFKTIEQFNKIIDGKIQRFQDLKKFSYYKKSGKIERRLDLYCNTNP